MKKKCVSSYINRIGLQHYFYSLFSQSFEDADVVLNVRLLSAGELGNDRSLLDEIMVAGN